MILSLTIQKLLCGQLSLLHCWLRLSWKWAQMLVKGSKWLNQYTKAGSWATSGGEVWEYFETPPSCMKFWNFKKEFIDFKKPEPFIPKSIGHYAEWLQACKTGSPTTCNFEYSGWLTESNHLGNVAFRAGKKLIWDADKIKATNCPEADPMIKREYRKS